MGEASHVAPKMRHQGQFLAKVTLTGKPWTGALMPSSVPAGICQESVSLEEDVLLLCPRSSYFLQEETLASMSLHQSGHRNESKPGLQLFHVRIS